MKFLEKRINKNRVTLWFSISAAFILAVIFSSFLITVISSFYMSNFILESMRSRIHDVVGLAVLKLDGDPHEKVQFPEHKNSAEFNLILDRLNQIRAINSEIKYVYTLRMNELGEIVFVVDSDPVLESRAEVGAKVENPPEGLIECFTSRNKIVVEKKYYSDKWGTWISGFAPFFDSQGKFVGVLAIDISVDTIKEHQIKSIIMLVVLSLFVSVLSGLISIWISKRITKPILQVTDEMSAIQKFNINHTIVPESGIVEIREMIHALENMKKSLRSFKKYVPSEIVADLIKLNKEAVLEAEKKDITILFSDIADFTSISEQVSPEILSRTLGLYLGVMTKTILFNSGTVDKYIGDAVMALWGAPHEMDNHPLAACIAALKCQKAIDHLNRRLVSLKQPAFHTRIGINTGDAIVGNMGYKQRLSYTAIGDNVNLASRLEALNKVYSTKIIISHNTYEYVKNYMAVKFLDIVAVKGKSKGSKIYELITTNELASENLKNYLLKYNSGMEKYLSRDWDGAISIFTSFKNEGYTDLSIDVMIDRCEKYKLNPPNLDWDGVFYLKEK
jgi:class 3 adenylate cyclase